MTAVSSGTAIVEARVFETIGLDTLTVVVPPNLAFHDFNDGTTGPYAHTADVDFPDDPTGSGRGKVARMFYNPVGSGGLPQHPVSNDENVAYVSAHHYRYGETIWFRGEVYLPSIGLSDHQQGNNRKLVDFYGKGPNSGRMILHRQIANGQLRLYLACNDGMDGTVLERFDADTGIILAHDTWYTIEVKMVTNSADDIRDGVVEVYINGAASPNYTRNTGIGWITEHDPTGPSYFSIFNAGEQLTIQYPTDPVYTEYRYWDNVAFSTIRIGR